MHPRELQLTIGMDQVGILQHFGKPETLLNVVKPAAAGNVDILNSRVSRPGMSRRVDGDECIPRPVTVLIQASAHAN